MRLLACCLLVATAQAARMSKPTPEDEIRALETQWNDARAHADVATLDRILSDDWTVTHANGTTDTKAKYLADLRTGARRFSGAVAVSGFVVRFYSDTTVAPRSRRSTDPPNRPPHGGKLHL